MELFFLYIFSAAKDRVSNIPRFYGYSGHCTSVLYLLWGKAVTGPLSSDKTGTTPPKMKSIVGGMQQIPKHLASQLKGTNCTCTQSPSHILPHTLFLLFSCVFSHKYICHPLFMYSLMPCLARVSWEDNIPFMVQRMLVRILVVFNLE